MDILFSHLAEQSRARKGQEDSLQDVGFGSYCFIFAQEGVFSDWHPFMDKANQMRPSTCPTSELRGLGARERARPVMGQLLPLT